jgi:hypothetical protein
MEPSFVVSRADRIGEDNSPNGIVDALAHEQRDLKSCGKLFDRTAAALVCEPGARQLGA